MVRTWGTPPDPTAFDHPDVVAAQDERDGVRRCRIGCVAIENARGEYSSTDSHSFTCHGCGGSVCIGCRSTPVSVGAMFCTPCGNAQASNYADMGAEDVEVPGLEQITAGQMRALLAGVGDDVPLVALHGPRLRTGMQRWEIVAARHVLQGGKANFALYLRETGARRA